MPHGMVETPRGVDLSCLFSYLGGAGHFYKVAYQAKASHICAGRDPMLLQQSACLSTALLHAIQCTCINTVCQYA